MIGNMLMIVDDCAPKRRVKLNKFLRYFILLPLAVSTVHSGDLVISFPVDGSSLELSGVESSTRVTSAQMRSIGEIGAPNLPVYTERIALPTGCAATGIEVLEACYSSLEGSYCIMPQQPQVPASMVDGYCEFVEPDESIYGSVSFYPTAPLSFEGSSVIMGIPVAYVRIYPVRWNPMDESLEVLSHITMKVSYESCPTARTVSRRSFQSELRSIEIVSNAVVNPEGVCGSGAAIIDSRDLMYGEYVIITIPEYEPYAQELADWKTSKGVPASVYTTDWIELNYSFYDLQQDIRAFLTDCRDNGVEFVLIYGDDDIVPGRDTKIKVGPTLEEYPPVDLYWADINDMIPGADMWDSNFNQIWGEFDSDLLDYHPDLWVGRASVNSSDECGIFNRKVFVYEGCASREIFENPETVEFIGYSTGQLTSTVYGSAGAELISPMVPSGWVEDKCYESTGTNGVQITYDMINSGPHHIYHATHGAPDRFNLHDGDFLLEHFMSLTNISSGGIPAVFNSIACGLGYLDDIECMADAWNNSPDGGGFGAFNARAGLLDPGSPGNGTSEILSRSFYQVMWNDDQYMLGVAHLMGTDEMAPAVNTAEDWCMKEYNLFGDPELPMWFGQPSTLDAVHVASISGTTSVTVTVTSSGLPVEGARVCLQKGNWKTGDIYLVDCTDASGICSFFLTPASTGDISVVAWARNHLYYQGTIEVTGTELDGSEAAFPLNSFGIVRPCPASGSVSIPFYISSSGMTELNVFDISGRLTANLAMEYMTAGEHSMAWDLKDSSGNDVPPGIYFVSISSSGWQDITNMVVAR